MNETYLKLLFNTPVSNNKIGKRTNQWLKMPFGQIKSYHNHKIGF